METMVNSLYFDSFKKELPHVESKVFVITGTTSGTGYIAARTVAEFGGEVVLLNRKSERVQTMMNNLEKVVPNGKFVSIECDLQNFGSVRKAIDEIKRKYTKIYCLANNAGIAAYPDQATVDGYDIQIQTNHLSHFLLTAELFQLLEAEGNENGEARIVNHSSLARLNTPNKRLEEKYFQKNGGNLGGDKMSLMGGASFHRYMQSKLANTVFTYALHDKLQEAGKEQESASWKNIRVICAHPGSADTRMASELKERFFWKVLIPLLTPLMWQSQEDGSMGLLKAMMHPDAKSGVLYGPSGGLGMKGLAEPNPVFEYEINPDAIDMLWKASEEATGVKFL